MEGLIDRVGLQLNPSPSEPLYLIANRLTLHYLSELNDVVEFGLNDRRHIWIIDSDDVYYRKAARYVHLVPGWEARLTPVFPSGPAMLKATLGLESIQTVDVEHRTQCYGLVLRHKDGWSAVWVNSLALACVNDCASAHDTIGPTIQILRRHDALQPFGGGRTGRYRLDS